MTTDERMEKMEGQLARVRWVNRCLIVCIVVGLGVWFISKTLGPATVWARSGAKEIRANRFIVEDENGKNRAALTAGKDGSMLAMYDENSKNRACLRMVEDGPMLGLYAKNGKGAVGLSVLKDLPDVALLDENGKPGAWLGVLKDGSMLVLANENGKTGASLSVDKDGPRLVLNDENGKPGAWLGVEEDGPALSLMDENGKTGASLSVSKEGMGLVLTNENGKPGASLAVLKDGPGLELYDENGKTRAQLRTGQTTTADGRVISYPESSLILFGADGKVIWSAPQGGGALAPSKADIYSTLPREKVKERRGETVGSEFVQLRSRLQQGIFHFMHPPAEARFRQAPDN